MTKKFMYINIILLILNINIILKDLYLKNETQEAVEEKINEEEVIEEPNSLMKRGYLSGVLDPGVIWNHDYETLYVMCPYEYIKDMSIPDTINEIHVTNCTDKIDFEQEEFDQIKTYEIDNSSYDISYIEKMTNLESLTIKDSNVDEVPYLHNANLKYLYLVITDITTIENIEGMKSLEVIAVPNDIKYITKSSYDYIKSNDIKVEISDHNAQQMVELDIDDLEII